MCQDQIKKNHLYGTIFLSFIGMLTFFDSRFLLVPISFLMLIYAFTGNLYTYDKEQRGPMIKRLNTYDRVVLLVFSIVVFLASLEFKVVADEPVILIFSGSYVILFLQGIYNFFTK